MRPTQVSFRIIIWDLQGFLVCLFLPYISGSKKYPCMCEDKVGKNTHRKKRILVKQGEIIHYVHVDTPEQAKGINIHQHKAV